MTRTVLAPAKINLCLHVLGKRPDGYHDLAMLMQPVSLFDTLKITLGGEPGVRVSCPGVELDPGGENLAARAAREVLLAGGVTTGVDIVIDKQIPVAAGLGGGSSDAAAVLNALDGMLGLGLGKERLASIGRTLGADVPFFVYGTPAWATGIGDDLQAVGSLPPLWYLLVNPGFAVSTAWAYGSLGLTSPGAAAKMPGFSRGGDDIVRLLHNDLESVTAKKFPVVTDIKERLLELGAAGALMSGSGPTVFGVFASEEVARAAGRVLASVPQWRVFVVAPLAETPKQDHV